MVKILRDWCAVLIRIQITFLLLGLASCSGNQPCNDDDACATSEICVRGFCASGNRLPFESTGGDVTIKASAAMTAEATGDMTVKGSAVTAEASGDMTVKGGDVTVEGGSVTISGGSIDMN